MRRGFAPHFRHVDDLFAPQNLTMPTISFRSCWFPFRKPPIFRMKTIFLPPPPQIDQIYRFIHILLGPILNFERRTPTDFVCAPYTLQNYYQLTRVHVQTDAEPDIKNTKQSLNSYVTCEHMM